MAMTPVYCLTVAGSPAIEISQDELRAILGQIEVKLHRSKTYRRALATVHQLLGESAEQANVLFKAVGREAIGLAFKQFATQQQGVAIIAEKPQSQNSQQDATEVVEVVKEGHNSNVSEHDKKNENEVVQQQPPEPENLTSNSHKQVKSSKDNPKKSVFLRWKQSPKKLGKAEQQVQIAAERVERLLNVGQQLRQVREAQCLTISQLHQHTRVPAHLIQALENGELDKLPEDVYVRGFIRLLGNALSLDGTALAGSLPTHNAELAVVPSWIQSHNYADASGGIGGFDLRPMHLYLGYTALVAGAVGGLAFLSQQSTPGKTTQLDTDSPALKSVSQSSNRVEPSAKPGLKSTTGVVIGADLAPPEAV